MGKGIVLNAEDARRVENAIRQVEARARAIGPYYRRRSRPSAGGKSTQIRLAYCKTDAGTGMNIDCYLDQDWDGSGTEPSVISVRCIIASGVNLNAAIPRLTDGLPIPVFQTTLGGQSLWICLWGFQASKDCT